MPFLGDTMFLHILDQMGRAHPAVYEPSVLDPDRPFSTRLAMTQAGREEIPGGTDWLSLQPPDRWLRGLRIVSNAPSIRRPLFHASRPARTRPARRRRP